VAEQTWKNRETGKLVTSDAMPAGPDWYLVGEDGAPIDTLGAVALNGRGAVGWRAGGARPAPPKPEKPIDHLRYGLDGPDLLGRSR
jgi:hypothetical protein